MKVYLNAGHDRNLTQVLSTPTWGCANVMQLMN